MASINVTLFTSKKLKNGESPIMLRFIKDRKVKYLNLGHSCHPDLWDQKRQLPKKKHPQALELELLINKKRSDANELLINMERNMGEFSLEHLITRFENKSKNTTVLSFLDETIAGLILENRIGNADAYKSLKYVLLKFRGGKDFHFIDIDQNFLKKFELNMRSRNLKETTLSVQFRTLRALYRRAIDSGYVKSENYPFNEFKISKFNIKTEKRAITKQEMKSIIDIDLSHSQHLEFARDLFVFSYYSSGINMIDLCKLDESNIIDGEILKYHRTKTNQKIVIRLLPVCLELIEKYLKGRRNDYIFPILSKKIHTSEAMIKNRVKKVTKQVNAAIKEIGSLLGMDSDRLTMYSARHTFATVLKRSGVSTTMISEMLGHDSLKTTEIYLDSFENEQLYEASLNL